MEKKFALKGKKLRDPKELRCVISAIPGPGVLNEYNEKLTPIGTIHRHTLVQQQL